MVVQALTRWEQSQKVLILDALELHSDNKAHAALYLGISLRTLRNKLHKFGLKHMIQRKRYHG